MRSSSRTIWASGSVRRDFLSDSGRSVSIECVHKDQYWKGATWWTSKVIGSCWGNCLPAGGCRFGNSRVYYLQGWPVAWGNTDWREQVLSDWVNVTVGARLMFRGVDGGRAISKLLWHPVTKVMVTFAIFVARSAWSFPVRLSIGLCSSQWWHHASVTRRAWF